MHSIEHYKTKGDELSSPAPLNTPGLDTLGTSGPTTETKPVQPFKISSSESDWGKVLKLAGHDMLTNGPLSILLRDLVMNSELEYAARKRSTYHGLRVYSQTSAIHDAEKYLSKIHELDIGDDDEVMAQVDRGQLVVFGIFAASGCDVSKGTTGDLESSKVSAELQIILTSPSGTLLTQDRCHCL